MTRLTADFHSTEEVPYDSVASAYGRRPAGAQFLTHHSARLYLRGCPVCPAFRQVARAAWTGRYPCLSAASALQTVGLEHVQGQRLRLALSLWRDPGQRLGGPAHPVSAPAAQTSRDSEPRRAPAILRGHPQSQAPGGADDRLRGRPARV